MSTKLRIIDLLSNRVESYTIPLKVLLKLLKRTSTLLKNPISESSHPQNLVYRIRQNMTFKLTREDFHK